MDYKYKSEQFIQQFVCSSLQWYLLFQVLCWLKSGSVQISLLIAVFVRVSTAVTVAFQSVNFRTVNLMVACLCETVMYFIIFFCSKLCNFHNLLYFKVQKNIELIRIVSITLCETVMFFINFFYSKMCNFHNLFYFKVQKNIEVYRIVSIILNFALVRSVSAI